MEKLGWKRLDSTIPTVSLSVSSASRPTEGLSNQESLRATKRCCGARAARGRRREYNRLSNLQPNPSFSFDRPLFHSIHAPRCTCLCTCYVTGVACLVVVMPVENSQSLPFDRESRLGCSHFPRQVGYRVACKGKTGPTSGGEGGGGSFLRFPRYPRYFSFQSGRKAKRRKRGELIEEFMVGISILSLDPRFVKKKSNFSISRSF